MIGSEGRKMTPPKNVHPHFAAWWVAALMLSSSCLAQDRGKMTLTDEELLGLCGQKNSHFAGIDLHRRRFDPNGVAAFLMDRPGTLVDGEFLGIPAPTEGELERLDREQVSFNFRVDKVYKGSAPDTIKVEVVSDMLAYPGRNTTRHAERMRILEYQDNILRPITDQIHALRRLFDSGQITEELYSTQITTLFRLVEETAAAHDFKVTDYTDVTAHMIHRSSTYYDDGEGIREGKPFLIEFDMELNASDTHVLDEVSTPIYSGEQREDVIKALTSPQGVVLPHPFRGYDPSDEQDCRALRELAGPPKSPPHPSEVARRLLDEFELVALGEFIGIPETDGGTLRAPERDLDDRASADLTIAFRIDRLYKGEVPGELEVVLSSDMLEVPGSGVSRYIRQGQIWSELESERRPHVEKAWAEMREWLLSGDAGSGVVDEQEMQGQATEPFEKEDNYHEKEFEYFTSIVGYMPGSLAGLTYFPDSFYDRGGAISPYERYLLAINRGRDSFGLWRVSDTADGPSRIYWGDEATEIMKQLEVLVR